MHLCLGQASVLPLHVMLGRETICGAQWGWNSRQWMLQAL